MSNIDMNSVVIQKNIYHLDDLFSIINVVEEKLKETSKLLLVLFESNQKYCGEDDNLPLQIKLDIKDEDVAEEASQIADSKEEKTTLVEEISNYNNIAENFVNDEEKADLDPDFKLNKEKSICKKKVKNSKKKKEEIEEKIESLPKEKKRPFQGGLCTTCGKDVSNLKRHIQMVHERVMKTYTCEFCNKEIVSHSGCKLYLHRQRCEAAATGVYDKFPCDICGAKFATVRKRYEHKIKCSGKVVKKYKCPPHLKCDFENCTFKTNNRLILQNHMNRHLNLPIIKNFSCDMCGTSYARKEQLTHHINSVHLNFKEFNCDQCGASFASKEFLKRHELIHTDIRPHQCPYCMKCFKQSAVLYRHKKSCPMNPNK